VNIAVPKYFSDQYKDTLMADPTVVNIKDKTAYFFEIANMLFPVMTESVTSSKTEMVVETFVRRFNAIIEKSERKEASDDHVFK
jgi:hypothetical protein